MTYDVVIVGAGPAGLAAAIRLKQRAPDLQIVVVEKAAEVGGHILSGMVMDPVGLDMLLPEWREAEDRPLRIPVREDEFHFLTAERSFRLPHALFPPLMSNQGCFVGSLGEVTRFLGEQAEALGVEIYAGFAAADLLIGDDGVVTGIITGDMGVGKDGKPTPEFVPGIALKTPVTLLAEGARGSLSKQAIARFDLAEGRNVQKYGIGLKEIWEVPEDRLVPGRISHSFGWPLDSRIGGGSFVYHGEKGMVTVGFVVHLDYRNPTLSPFQELQRFKTHPTMRALLEGGRRIAYGARALTEGGWQSVPRLDFPGGALIGCAAGFMNVPRIKGSHNAILSGILAADAIADGKAADGSIRAADLARYEAGWRSSPIGRDLYPVRNVKPLWSRYGLPLGVALGGLDMWANTLFRASPCGTLAHKKPDYASLDPIAAVTPIAYPKPDNKLTFDRLSSVYLTGTYHEENQPCHLKLADPAIPIRANLPLYGEPAQLYCPAGVYEVTPDAQDKPTFVINAQNCIHCKTCDIKDPAQNITWTPPHGGPAYVSM